MFTWTVCNNKIYLILQIFKGTFKQLKVCYFVKCPLNICNIWDNMHVTYINHKSPSFFYVSCALKLETVPFRLKRVFLRRLDVFLTTGKNEEFVRVAAYIPCMA